MIKDDSVVIKLTFKFTSYFKNYFFIYKLLLSKEILYLFLTLSFECFPIIFTIYIYRALFMEIYIV